MRTPCGSLALHKVLSAGPACWLKLLTWSHIRGLNSTLVLPTYDGGCCMECDILMDCAASSVKRGAVWDGHPCRQHNTHVVVVVYKIVIFSRAMCTKLLFMQGHVSFSSCLTVSEALSKQWTRFCYLHYRGLWQYVGRSRQLLISKLLKHCENVSWIETQSAFLWCSLTTKPAPASLQHAIG